MSKPEIFVEIKINVVGVGEVEVYNTEAEKNGRKYQATILNIKLQRPVTTEDIKSDVFRGIIEAVKPFTKNPLIVLSGRMPVWLYAYLVHRLAHIYEGVATFEPKTKTAIIVCSHWKLDLAEGDELKLPEELAIKLVQA